VEEIRSRSRTTPEGEKSEPEAQERSYVPVPEDWDALSDDEKDEVTRAMAEALQKRLLKP